MKSDLDKEMLLLYSNCKIVKGFSRSLICDLQLQKMLPIPNSLADLFTINNELHYKEIKKKLSIEDLGIFESYLQLLLDEEVVFFCSSIERLQFPMLSAKWDYPAIITNCIIDAKEEMTFLNENFIKQLDGLGCYHIQLRFYNPPSSGHLSDLLEVIEPSELQSVELIIKSTNDHSWLQEIIALSDRHVKVRSIIIHSHSEDLILKELVGNRGMVVTSKRSILSEKNCGIIDQNIFQINIPHFTESLVHNTCLNRKISIDMEGNIKNCPSMQISHGNIRENNLLEIVNRPEFKKLWNVNKDEIDKCRDCEFRHVCTDCRAYLENPDDIYSAPLKCGYNPYTCSWEDWSTNPLKEKSSMHYGLQAIVNK